MIILEIIFWTFLFVIFYTFIGYGILLYLLVKIKELFVKPFEVKLPSDENLPFITLFIAAYNEASVIEKKFKNSVALDYPADKLLVLFVTDGCTDATVDILQSLANKRAENLPVVRVENCSQRRGKAAAFDRGMKFAEGDIIVFTDSNTMLNSESLREIVKSFFCPDVGCVAGEKRVEKESGAGEGAVTTEGVYWKYESLLKSLDYRLYSAVGAAGELFAVRKSLYETLPDGTLLDDFILSMKIVEKGYVIAYNSNAYAIEGTSANMKEESKRKRRIAAGGIQSIGMLMPLLNPFKYPLISFQFFSHRVLRWIVAPFLLAAILPINIIIVCNNGGIIYNVLLICQVAIYLLGIIGYILSIKGRKIKILYIIYYFIFMNLNVFAGILYLFRRKSTGMWEKAERA